MLLLLFKKVKKKKENQLNSICTHDVLKIAQYVQVLNEEYFVEIIDERINK